MSSARLQSLTRGEVEHLVDCALGGHPVVFIFIFFEVLSFFGGTGTK